MNEQEDPLQRAVQSARDAADVGFDWPDAWGALEKVREETSEVGSAVESGEKSAQIDELGDLLFAVCNVARKLDIDPGAALDHATMKFEARFALVLESVRESGKKPEELALDELESLWQRAKQRHGS